MRSLIISIFLLFVLVATPKHVLAEPFQVPGFPHIDVADVFYAPWFKDTSVFGVFGGYLGGDRGGQVVDWSTGNTIPHSGSMTDDIVFSTSVGDLMNPANWFERMRITKEGNVGIGTADPSAKLHIDAGSLGSGDHAIIVNADVSTNPFNNQLLLRGSGVNSEARLGFVTTIDDGSGHHTAIIKTVVPGDGGGHLIFQTRNLGFSGISEHMRITNTGNVSIGTTSPAGKLDVNGTIFQRVSSLHADYVFESDYNLESIEEHAAFMWKEKHLKAIPKTKVDENGIEIVEVGAHNKGIVEELEKTHIYISHLEEKLAKLESQQRNNKALESRLAKLEARLNGM